MLLFFGHFCPRKLIYSEKIIAVNHATDRFVDAVDRRSSCFPLLNRNRQSFLSFRAT